MNTKKLIKQSGKKQKDSGDAPADSNSFQAFLKDHASQINALNTHIPSIIRLFGSDAKAATRMA
jgi:hypothetical protein